MAERKASSATATGTRGGIAAAIGSAVVLTMGYLGVPEELLRAWEIPIISAVAFLANFTGSKLRDRDFDPMVDSGALEEGAIETLGRVV